MLDIFGPRAVWLLLSHIFSPQVWFGYRAEIKLHHFAWFIHLLNFFLFVISFLFSQLTAESHRV